MLVARMVHAIAIMAMKVIRIMSAVQLSKVRIFCCFAYPLYCQSQLSLCFLKCLQFPDFEPAVLGVPTRIQLMCRRAYELK